MYIMQLFFTKVFIFIDSLSNSLKNEFIINYISISNKTVFEIIQISYYLQIECLNKICWDNFVYSLNIKTLNDLISLVENYPLLTKDLKEVALKFKKSKRPAVKGLCLFEYSHGIYSKHFF